MSRPRRSEHTREALIQEGIQQISSFGYHGTGIKQILDKVKVPKGSFYNFFASKEAFVAEVIAAYSANLMEQLTGFIQGPGKTLTPTQQLTAICDISIDKIVGVEYRQSCLIGALSPEVSAESQTCCNALQLATDTWLTFFIDRISAAQQSGEIRQDLSAIQLADLYWATWEGVLIRLHVDKNPDTAKQNMKVMLTSLMAG